MPQRGASPRRATVPFNPLFLYGGVGLGKTHLMHAIAWHIRKRTPQRRVIYLSAEKFMYQFIRALRFKDTMAFKEQFRSVDVLMIDDVQFISGKDSTQEEFFHTFNALVDQNRQIVVSADKSPSDLEGLEERDALAPRLGPGRRHPSDDLRAAPRHPAVQGRAARREVPPRCWSSSPTRSPPTSASSKARSTASSPTPRWSAAPITLERRRRCCTTCCAPTTGGSRSRRSRSASPSIINIRLADMHSARRARAVARPRQVAMYLAKQLTTRSLPEIGRKFGGRDHTTVMHAVRKIEELRASDRQLRRGHRAAAPHARGLTGQLSDLKGRIAANGPPKYFSCAFFLCYNDKRPRRVVGASAHARPAGPAAAESPDVLRSF